MIKRKMDASLPFDEYLEAKNINPKKMKIADISLYNNLKTLFDQIHPNSFTQQKLFLINKLRRKYL